MRVLFNVSIVCPPLTNRRLTLPSHAGKPLPSVRVAAMRPSQWRQWIEIKINFCGHVFPLSHHVYIKYMCIRLNEYEAQYGGGSWAPQKNRRMGSANGGIFGVEFFVWNFWGMAVVHSSRNNENTVAIGKRVLMCLGQHKVALRVCKYALRTSAHCSCHINTIRLTTERDFYPGCAGGGGIICKRVAIHSNWCVRARRSLFHNYTTVHMHVI